MQTIWSTVDTIVKEGTMSMIDGVASYEACQRGYGKNAYPA